MPALPAYRSSAATRARAAASAGAFAMAALGGCAANPEVRAIRAEMGATTAEATEVKVILELVNPNDAPVELTVWDYSLEVNGRSAYAGKWIASLTLPPKESMLAELPTVVPASLGTPGPQTRWRIGGTMGFRATSKLDVLLYQLGFNRLSAGFSTGTTGVGDRSTSGRHVLPGPGESSAPVSPAPSGAPPSAPGTGQ
jgi:hypothetical protein